MLAFFSRYLRLDWPLVGSVFGIIALGLLAISSVDLSYGTTFDLLKHELIALALGGIA